MSFVCPYCQVTQVVAASKSVRGQRSFDIGKTDIGHSGMTWTAIACSNPECNKLTLAIWVGEFIPYNGRLEPKGDNPLFRETVLPRGRAKPLPEFVPAPIREDYTEACLICELSPKASATLIRRCIQGMIRDFCGITKRRLIDEIDELRRRVDENDAPLGVSIDSIDSIDAVRKIGNIGAHMEADIDKVISVDAGEAQTLIKLTESLIDDWYIERDKRTKRFDAVRRIALDKGNQADKVRSPEADEPTNTLVTPKTDASDA